MTLRAYGALLSAKRKLYRDKTVPLSSAKTSRPQQLSHSPFPCHLVMLSLSRMTTLQLRKQRGPVKSDVGINQTFHIGPKKDLGVLGYVSAVVFMVTVILLGSGITAGYIYWRVQKLKSQQEQDASEREQRRINLHLSAFSNLTCQTVDENSAVSCVQQTPIEHEDIVDGNGPLMVQAGTAVV
ncbi:phosphoinositide-3-kinase-interacting protein 1-like [Esox lucius]|uniref:phosphoinositide-3-kinase-interacting protein 1-like n=1 Tax=Esox lucius TaxID=8010 RepID=UPI00147706B1|nr:phosphoinositide-3-kinase-interacting protein 1-like [Esox lucius]XP_034152992.1 phosphoinositide-3-kinase-interacting protein 1-like [Esox lucius]